MNAARRETPARLLLRAVLLLAPVLAVLCALPTVPPSTFFLGLVMLLAAGFAARPESPFGIVCLGTVTLWWALRTSGGDVPVGVVPAAGLLLAAHVAAVLLAYGPTGSPLGVPVVRRWLRRGLVVGVAAPAVWALARLVDGQPEPPGIWVAGLLSAIAVCVVAATAVAAGRPEPS